MEHPPDPDKLRRASVLALLALGLWSAFAVLAIKLRGVPPFLLLGVSLCLGSLVGLRRAAVRGLTPGLLLMGVYGLFT